MDKHYLKTFQELNNMQSKIASIFKDLLIERYHYKLSSDKLKKNLEEVSTEVRNLKIQNEKLQQGNQQLKNVIYECINVFRCLDFSEISLMEDHKIVLDTLERILAGTNNVGLEPVETGVTVKKEMCLDGNENSARRCKISQDDIEKEIDAIKDLQFNTQFFDNVELSNEMEFLGKNQSGFILEKIFERKSNDEIENFEKTLFVKETEVFDEKNSSVGPAVQETVDPISELERQQMNMYINESVFCINNNNIFKPIEACAYLNSVTTPKKNLLNSPVFKDFGNRKQENLSTEENGVEDTRGKMNIKLLLKSDYITSPIKKPSVDNRVSPKRQMSSPNKIRKKQRFDSPKKSSVNQLQKSNSRDVEISSSGVRKLTQTLLNVECFKRKTPEKKNGEIFENENSGPKKASETKILCDIDEDDVIMESPKISEDGKVLEDVKSKKKTGSGLNGIPLLTPSMTAEADLDETYVSALIIQKCQMTDKNILEKIEEEQTPVKRSNCERGLECDSVPFFYKREAIRSKAERMKLPGQACLECNKYYKNALGEDLSPRKLKEILNKCSRHRDKNPPSLDDTPPGEYSQGNCSIHIRHYNNPGTTTAGDCLPAGYWKPYLTASVLTSHNEDDTTSQ